MVEDVEVVLVPTPSREELGELLCDLLSRYGYVKAVRDAARGLGVMISVERMRKLLREFCPDLYLHVRRTNVARFLARKRLPRPRP